MTQNEEAALVRGERLFGSSFIWHIVYFFNRFFF
jgi:hypothetical protein